MSKTLKLQPVVLGHGWISRPATFYVKASQTSGALGSFRFLFRILSDTGEIVYSIPDMEQTGDMITPDSNGIIRLGRLSLHARGGIIAVHGLRFNTAGLDPVVRGQCNYSIQSRSALQFVIEPDLIVTTDDTVAKSKQLPGTALTGGFQVGTGGALPFSASINRSGTVSYPGDTNTSSVTNHTLRATELKVTQLAYPPEK